jgi:hypothetical protein
MILDTEQIDECTSSQQTSPSKEIVSISVLIKANKYCGEKGVMKLIKVKGTTSLSLCNSYGCKKQIVMSFVLPHLFGSSSHFLIDLFL